MKKKQLVNSTMIEFDKKEIHKIKRFCRLFQTAKLDDSIAQVLQNNEILQENYGIDIAYRVDSEKSLKPRCHLNPPPRDGKCMCCGKHISELKPFGKAGDPLIGNFEGALLLKTHRPMGPYDDESFSKFCEAEDLCGSDEDPEGWLIKKYGKEKGEHIYLTVLLNGTFEAIWSCRDCYILDENEYFERLCGNSVKNL